MTIFHLTALLGGLAMFLFGMDLMGKALERQAGGRLQTILSRLTDNPIKGLLMGLLVTAVIQSSSATTVMVVGFVNSGIIQLGQAVGIIMGSNIGTTVTGWVLSLAGVEGDSFFVRLLKPSNFSPLLAFVGILLYLQKAEKRRGIGTILLGFAVLMTGMESMSASMKPLAGEPWFTGLFLRFSNPILGVLAGAILTAVIQSSSASVGILQALALSGGVSAGAALPIIMGQNIGTCVTALLSSVGTTKNARRAAMVHFYFNLIGVVLFLSLFYTYTIFFPLPQLGRPIRPVGIALIHSLFNVSVTLVLLPFHSVLERLAVLSVPEGRNHEPEEFVLLDSRLLNTPAVAADRAQITAIDLANLSRSALLKSMSLVHCWDKEIFESVCREEAATDRYEDLLGSYLVHLSAKPMNLRDTHRVNLLLHCISDFERMGDHALNLAQAAQTLQAEGAPLSPAALKELRLLEHAVQDLLDKTLAAFETGSLTTAKKVEPLEQVVDELVRELKARHIARLQNGDCGQAHGYLYNDILNDLERVADHCSNVAVDMIEVDANSFDTHRYLEQLREGKDADFERRYARYAERYSIPEE